MINLRNTCVWKKLLWDCTFACDPDIDAFFTFLWRRKCLSDHIQFVSVYLIASGLHNSRPAKWGQLHGLMGVISILEGSLVIDLQHKVCLESRKRSNIIAFIWNRLEAASWSIVTTPWSVQEDAGLTFAWYWHISLCWTTLEWIAAIFFIERLRNKFPRRYYAFLWIFVVVSGSVSIVQTWVQSYLGGAAPHWRALTHNGPGLPAIQRLIFWAESKHTPAKTCFICKLENELFPTCSNSKEERGG